MVRGREQPPVEIDARRIDSRPRAALQKARCLARPARHRGKNVRRKRIDEQHPRERREEFCGKARERHQRRVEADHGLRRGKTVEQHAQRDRRPGGMADDHIGGQIELGHQRADRARHPDHRQPAGRTTGRKPMPRQIGRNDGEMLGQQRQQIAPAMRRRPRAVEQQHDRPGPRHLNVPAHPFGLDEAAEGAVGPVAAFAAPVGRAHAA